jgi:hypothetical protein
MGATSVDIGGGDMGLDCCADWVLVRDVYDFLR